MMIVTCKRMDRRSRKEMDSFKLGCLRIKCLSLSPRVFMVREGTPVGSLLLPFSRTARLATEVYKRELPKLSARMDS
jgi:hypothetical protein